MKLVPAKCPCCGADIQVDETMQKTFCQYCGSQFFVEAASAYQKMTIEGVVQTKAADFDITAGVLKKYHGESVDVIIPENVISIGSFAFEGMKIRSVVFPSSLIEIGLDAFQDCENLKSVEFPNTLKTIGCSAFSRCFSLEEAIMPNSIEKVYPYAFEWCSSLKKMVLSESIETIQHETFQGCSSLKSIHIPPKVEIIEYNAFFDCSSLEEVVIDNPNVVFQPRYDGTPYTAENAFTNTPWLINMRRSEEELRAARRRECIENNLCQYCGGRFQGLISKKCSVCGQPKDY